MCSKSARKIIENIMCIAVNNGLQMNCIKLSDGRIVSERNVIYEFTYRMIEFFVCVKELSNDEVTLEIYVCDKYGSCRFYDSHNELRTYEICVNGILRRNENVFEVQVGREMCDKKINKYRPTMNILLGVNVRPKGYRLNGV